MVENTEIIDVEGDDGIDDVEDVDVIFCEAS